jgi:hypothetical protein
MSKISAKFKGSVLQICTQVAHDLKIMLFFIASTLWMSYNSIGNSIL